MKENVKYCFNKNAATYDSAASLQITVAEKLAQTLPDTAYHILEIGCGTGVFSEHLLQRYPKAQLLLTDLAPNMVNQCQQRLGQYNNIQFLCMDGEHLTIDKKYDLIVSNMSLHWFTEHEESFNKIIQQLAANGEFIFSMVGNDSLLEWRAIYEKYKYPQATPLFPSSEKLSKLLQFKTMQTERILYSYQNAYEFVRSLKRTGASAVSEDKIPLASGKLRKIFREFQNEFVVSYEIIYGHYINHE